MKSKNVGMGYILRFYSGEELIKELTEFCIREKIESGWVWGLGAVESATLGFFDPESKSYVREEIDSHFEIASLTGNISLMEGKPSIHIHVCLGTEDFEIVGGHLFFAIVSATAELFVMNFAQRIDRKPDTATGLSLLFLE